MNWKTLFSEQWQENIYIIFLYYLFSYFFSPIFQRLLALESTLLSVEVQDPHFTSEGSLAANQLED